MVGYFLQFLEVKELAYCSVRTIPLYRLKKLVGQPLHCVGLFPRRGSHASHTHFFTFINLTPYPFYLVFLVVHPKITPSYFLPPVFTILHL